MNILLGNIGIIFTNIITWLGQIASALIQNPIFAVLMAVIIFTLLINLLINMIARNKSNKKYKDMENWDLEDFDADLEQWKAEHPGAYEENGTWVAPLE